MPIEIKELNIKVTVENDPATSRGEQGHAPELDMDEIVARCVAQVMDILKEKSER